MNKFHLPDSELKIKNFVLRSTTAGEEVRGLTMKELIVDLKSLQASETSEMIIIIIYKNPLYSSLK